MKGYMRRLTPWDDVFRLRRAGKLEAALAKLESRLDEEDAEYSPSLGALRASLRGEMARVAWDRGEIGKAEGLIRRAVEEAPEYPDLRYLLGRVLIACGETAAGRESLEEALRISPRYIAPVLALSILDANEGRLGEAIAALEELSQKSPPADEPSFQRALTFLREGSWEEAGPELLRAYREPTGELADAHYRIGRHLDEERPLDALEEAKSLALAYPNHPDAHHAVGLACLSLDWRDDALEAFHRALGVNPDYHEARIYLAWVLFSRGDSIRAECELKRILMQEPRHSNARALLEKRGAVGVRKIDQNPSPGEKSRSGDS